MRAGFKTSHRNAVQRSLFLNAGRLPHHLSKRANLAFRLLEFAAKLPIFFSKTLQFLAFVFDGRGEFSGFDLDPLFLFDDPLEILLSDSRPRRLAGPRRE